MIDVDKIRKDFPSLSCDRPFIYFDNAATTLKPQSVIDEVCLYLGGHCANIHRGLYHNSKVSSDKYEEARVKTAKFISAGSSENVIFTKNTTESIAIVAASLRDMSTWAKTKVLVPKSEHHSNVLPWMTLEEQGFEVDFINVDSEGRIDMEHYKSLLDYRVGLVAVAIATNVLGVVNPVEEMCELAHSVEAFFLADGAQAVARMPLNFEKSGFDFLAFSGHKMFAPPGVGVLAGKKEYLEELRPLAWGGGTVSNVTFNGFMPRDLPGRLEPGTPDIAAVLGLAKAVEYIEDIGIEEIAAYEEKLLEYALEKFEKVPGMTIYGPKSTKDRIAVISFSLEGWGVEDLPLVMDKTAGIALRSGYHCAIPLVKNLNKDGVVRASFSIYNTFEEVDRMAEILMEIAD